MTPAITVLPMHDSMPTCIYRLFVSLCPYLFHDCITSPWLRIVLHPKFAGDCIPLSPSAVPALTCPRWGSWRQADCLDLLETPFSWKVRVLGGDDVGLLRP
jgi:hypothetical protein